MGEREEEPAPVQAIPPPPALPLTQALSQAVAVSKDPQEVFEAYSSITWDERERKGCCGVSLAEALPCICFRGVFAVPSRH